ncbi:flagellar biosynthesis protein FlhB [Syntrophus aciditrophicus]|uniref:Flagellar biosynthetic protein FlhB n=1 Tax=Syntrophus aciditrophicus (strain SB) TaxID=56780 RepID=Q2LT07_SYNAS|nr:flagellar biosynthesis protein FlhB [Syntrophus aciditrophicus]ABC77217.1 flagellar biosynthesis pathway component [Syntrophus aciditrophicus SB]
MAESNKDQERTEEATPKRREEAREQGQVAKSRDLASVAILSACLLYFYFGANSFLHQLMDLMKSSFSSLDSSLVTTENIQSLLFSAFYKTITLMTPFLLVVCIAALSSNILQVGFKISTKAIAPKLSKIDPAKGFARLFSLQSLIEFIKSIFKISIAGFVAYLTVKSELVDILPLADSSVWEILVYITGTSFRILLTTCWVLIILALMDYLYQRWEYERNLKMSRQEIKDENKQTEGDPIVKARIRRLQREMAQRRMMANVPKADVIITNPTHLAVALQYDQDSMIAPKVIAKGAGYLAEKIKEIARESRVPLVENKPLAQVLYKMVEVSGTIPDSLYKAVAEILAYIYSIKRE